MLGEQEKSCNSQTKGQNFLYSPNIPNGLLYTGKLIIKYVLLLLLNEITLR